MNNVCCKSLMKMHQKGNAADSPPMETNKLLDTQKVANKKEKNN